jgi:hypothetical protein
MSRAEKIPRLRIKTMRVEEHDWRGFLALTIAIGYMLLLALQVPGTEMLGVAVGLIIGWYFGEKRREKAVGVKFPRATEKHPDYPRIRAQLVEALRQTESYNPAYDDLVISEIAKTVIDIRKVDKAVEAAENLTQLHKAVKIKATLLDMLESFVEVLAMTRRSRLKHEQVEVKDGMMERLQNIIKPEG